MSVLASLQSLSHGWLVAVTIILTVVAIALMVIVVYWTDSSVTKAGAKKAPKLPPPQTPLPPVQEDRLPPLWGWFSSYLVRKGFYRVSELSLSFLKALQFLSERLDTLDYKYRLPWYLLIGASHSGKTTLLEGSEPSLPVGRPNFSEGETYPGCSWWFFNRAVVLDIRGDFLIKDRGVECEERGWKGLLALLARYRSKRPIDGIILCIPADELYGQWRLSPEELQDRARFLGNKLRASQGDLGIRLPIYIIVTKCDIIPGFQNFCAAIPESHRHDMLGWSNPHMLTAAFTPVWIEEAFERLQRTLHHLRLEIFAEGQVEDGNDGLFVMVSEFLRLQDPVATYVQSIFKESSYEDSLMLRGIYFTGDAGGKVDQQLLTHLFSQEKSTALADVSTGLPYPQHRIFFAKHLFSERIFREVGLVEPLYKRLISANRNINIAKGSILLIISLGTFGLLRSYDRFTHQRDFLVPALNQIVHNMREIEMIRAGEAPAVLEKFDSYARELIEMMSRVSHTKFFSVFSLPSWFSSLDTHLKEALGKAYEEIIIRTLHLDLVKKARDLLEPPEKAPEKTTTMTQLLIPTTMPEAVRFRNFALGFIELMQHVEKYNHLSETSDASLIGDLILYAFGISMPPEFDREYHIIHSVLNRINMPPLDMRSSIPLARQRLLEHYKEFIAALMGPSNPASLIGRVHEIVRTFGQQRDNHLPSVEILRRFVSESAPIIDSLGTPGQTWMDGAYFDPGSGFSDLMQQVSQSPLFGIQVVHELAKESTDVFKTFVSQLQQLSVTLFKNKAETKFFPSQALIDLEKSLEKLMAESFMTKIEDTPLKTLIPGGKMILWDNKLIDSGLEMTKAFDEFTTKKLDTYPALLQNMIKLVAAQTMQKNIISLIAQAQNFVDAPKGESGEVISEGLLRNKIKDAKLVTNKFLTLLNTIEKSQTGVTFVALRDMLAEMAYKLLTYIESLLQAYPPYLVKGGNFDWWDGKEGAALEGYAVKDENDLRTYLDAQADRIFVFALEYAENTVNFLTAPIIQETQIDKSLVTRWRRMVDQAKLEQKKRPESSVKTLEEFITKDMNTITLDTCFDKIPLADVKGNSGDYFLEIRQKLRRGMLSRCEVLKRRSAIENYEEMVTFFNTNLKGKFPFIGDEANAETPEVEPQDLRDFFKLYEKAGGSPEKILNQIYQLGDKAQEAIVFLKSLEGLKNFLKGYLTDEKNVDAPFVDLDLDFRVNKSKEKGANLIIEWYLKPNDETKITNNDKKKEARWIFDNAVEVGFRWADGIDKKPFRDKGQPYMSVDGTTAIYTFPGRWSLFWLLRNQRCSSKDLAGSGENKPYILRFEIPTGPNSKAIVYTRVTLMEPGKGGKMLKLPVFPLEAPSLPKEIFALKDKAVLAQGEIEPAEFKDKDEEGESSEDSEKEESSDAETPDEGGEESGNEESSE